MKKDYIKLPVEILYDARFGTLADDLWRLVMQLYLLAGEADQDGLLPHARDMAWELRIGLGTLQISLHQLCERGLVHQTPQGWVVTGFKESQAAASNTERSRAFRKRRKLATQNEAESNADAVVQDPAPDPIRSPTPYRTYGASEMQPARHLPVSNPVSNPVAKPDPDPGQPGPPGKKRHRHKPKQQPVEKPVENIVDKGRKNSDPTPGTTSTSSLIKYLSTTSLTKNLKPSSTSSLTKYLKTSSTSSLTKNLRPGLNIKPPLPVLPDQPDLEKKPENLRSSQGKSLENTLNAPGNAPVADARQVPPARIEAAAQPRAVIPENFREPVDTCPVDTCPVDNHPVDKTVDKPVENAVEIRPQEKGRKISDPDDIPP